MNSVAIDTVWVVVAGCLVLLMQAGFACLEMGLSRMKHSGAVAAKILVKEGRVQFRRIKKLRLAGR